MYRLVFVFAPILFAASLAEKTCPFTAKEFFLEKCNPECTVTQASDLCRSKGPGSSAASIRTAGDLEKFYNFTEKHYPPNGKNYPIAWLQDVPLFETCSGIEHIPLTDESRCRCVAHYRRIDRISCIHKFPYAACEKCDLAFWTESMPPVCPTRCDPGKYNTVYDDECRACGPGTRTNDARTGCEACAAGTYSAGLGNAKCIRCADGHISGSKASECEPCDPGTGPNDNQTACEGCEPGTFSHGAAACEGCLLHTPDIPSGDHSFTGRTACMIRPLWH